MRLFLPLALAALLTAGCADRSQTPEASPPPSPSAGGLGEASEREAAPSAEAAQEGALRVGDLAPDFTLPDADGGRIRLADLLAEGPVVLTFYRGAWCPYCNTSLRSLQQTMASFEGTGARLVAISPQTPDGSRETVETSDLWFPVLSDVGNVVSRQFGLVFRVGDDIAEQYRAVGIDLSQANGDGRWELPVPATYVIDRDGTIRAAFVEADYTQRADPRDVLAAVQALGNGPA